jgi:xanthine dehydrogenase accessory factor
VPGAACSTSASGVSVASIGLPDIAGKAPAVIAASSVAQLLAVWEASGHTAYHPELQPEFL